MYSGWGIFFNSICSAVRDNTRFCWCFSGRCGRFPDRMSPERGPFYCFCRGLADLQGIPQKVRRTREIVFNLSNQLPACYLRPFKSESRGNGFAFSWHVVTPSVRIIMDAGQFQDLQGIPQKVRKIREIVSNLSNQLPACYL